MGNKQSRKPDRGWFNDLPNKMYDTYEVKPGTTQCLDEIGSVQTVREKGTGVEYQADIYRLKDVEDYRPGGCENLLKVYRTVDHPSIMKLHAAYKGKKKKSDSITFIRTNCEGGDLFSWIVDSQAGRIEEKDAGPLVREVLEAVFHLHCREIVHRNIKPETIHFTDKIKERAQLKLRVDLLCTAPGAAEGLDELCGTPQYIPPEVFAGEPYGKPFDLWSIGVTTFSMLSGYGPFDAMHDIDIIEKTKNQEVEFDPSYWDQISDDGKDFVTRLLKKDPGLRMTCSEALAHPWVNKYDRR